MTQAERAIYEKVQREYDIEDIKILFAEEYLDAYDEGDFDAFAEGDDEYRCDLEEGYILFIREHTEEFLERTFERYEKTKSRELSQNETITSAIEYVLDNL